MKFDINFFNVLKPEIVWLPIVEWIKGKGSYRHFAWKGFKLTNGKKTKDNAVLLVLKKLEKNLQLSTRNLSFLKINSASDLNAYQAFTHRKIILTKDALEELTKRLKT